MFFFYNFKKKALKYIYMYTQENNIAHTRKQYRPKFMRSEGIMI